MKTVFQNLKKTDWLLAAVCLAFIALQVVGSENPGL